MSDATVIACLSIGLSIFTVVSVFAIYKKCCANKRRGVVYNHTAPVVVTSQSHAPQGSTVVQTTGYYPPQVPGNPPQGLGYPPPTGYQPGQYPQHAQYPPTQQSQPPYPVHQNAPVVGVQPPVGFNQDPPSYDQIQQQDNTMYVKQPPYNPSYTGQQ